MNDYESNLAGSSRVAGPLDPVANPVGVLHGLRDETLVGLPRAEAAPRDPLEGGRRRFTDHLAVVADKFEPVLCDHLERGGPDRREGLMDSMGIEVGQEPLVSTGRTRNASGDGEQERGAAEGQGGSLSFGWR